MLVVDQGRTHRLIDYAPLDRAGSYIDVGQVLPVMPVSGLYFERKRSIRLVWNYILDIGLGNTLIKIFSRSAEGLRNKKYLTIGSGKLVGGDHAGATVIFVAPTSPRVGSRLWLPAELFHPTDVAYDESVLRVLSADLPDAALKASLEALSGWDPNSGADIRVPSWEPVIDAIRSARVEETIPLVRMPPTTTRPSTEAPTGSRLGATLFGWGNYAKTIIVPSLPKEIALNRVHEVDPLQIPATTRYTWSTEATISADDSNPIVFVAGYHHTHNAIACAALRSGKAVVVEKPLVTTRAQLRELEDTARAGNRGRYFACFHKRYSPFNAIAIEDLGVAHTGEPIDYHCVVYEVPLPQKHWYRWPNSSTRIISNGCHWIDHFLFLNRFSTPANIVCAQAKSGVANVFIELENGASFSMTLTDVGSERIGVQDYIELRHKGSTVKITNGSRYEAENGAKVLRRKSINKISGYRNMYSQICRAIVDGRDGDSEISYLVSSETVLSVNEYFEQGC